MIHTFQDMRVRRRITILYTSSKVSIYVSENGRVEKSSSVQKQGAEWDQLLVPLTT